ncbi:MAG: hypothetical protein ISR65_18525 [Bacteriovoracaceae bacterium]|nr:hypothetical protein [candidate division KSB1 bacterium]MBL6991784.1 hypothetical protein [Bacteriovoracaceae bacterium]
MKRSDYEDKHFEWQYEHTIWVIPDYMRGNILDYIFDKRPVGEFLTAVICNDMKTAIGKADGNNLRNIQAYLYFFYNYAPALCWGSKEAMEAWLK